MGNLQLETLDSEIKSYTCGNFSVGGAFLLFGSINDGTFALLVL